MPINHDAVGATSQPTSHSWTSKDCLLYALGVGAGTDELAFTTENTKDVPQQVLPTAAVIFGMGGTGAMAALGEFNPAMLVHGEQAIEVLGPIPVEGSVTSVGEITGIWDKGKGAVVVLESRSTNDATGEPLFRNTTSLFIRGEGGWGGERGPGSDRNTPPDRDPDHAVTYQTREDQALLYRLSGDRNPLHSDPAFAQRAGFEKPILHGLCTYGFTGRALLHTLCGSDPTRFRGMEGRFASPVYPGETLTVKMWETGDGTAIFQTCGGDGRVVVDGGSCTYTA